MNKIKANWFSLLLILPFLGLMYYNFFWGRSEKVKFGKPANIIRKSTKVPIINADMKRIKMSNNVVGGQWDGKDDRIGLIHVRKIVSPYIGEYLLNEEWDMFKKYKNKNTYWQLSIVSKILGDSVSIREGRLWLRCNGCTDIEQPLNENGLDSLFTEWGLKDLVKKDGI